MPRRRRGYPVAVLVGLDKGEAHLWDVYSESVKPAQTLASLGSEYSLSEAVVDQLRSRVKEGVKTVVVASEDRARYQSLLSHVERHHGWLIRGRGTNTVTFTYLKGRATAAEEVRALAASEGLRSILWDASEGGLDAVMGALEERLGTSEGIDSLIMSLEEVEAQVYSEKPPEFILMTEGFTRRYRSRAQRLTQVAHNRAVKTVTVPEGSRHAPRLEQLGGIVGLARVQSP